MILFGLLVFF